MIQSNDGRNAPDVFVAIEEMQRSMNLLNNTIQQQQSEILRLSSSQQQALKINIPDANGPSSYQNMMRRLISTKYSNSNFVPRDRHDIDFLAKMLEDYESGLLPTQTKEAWQDRVSLLNTVAENGWPHTVQRMRESNSLVLPRQLSQIYQPQRNLRIGNGSRYGRWHDKVNQKKI